MDGAPVDRALLSRMTKFMSFRGPDGQQIWMNDNVGFGHTLLKTTEESNREHQPFTLDGRVWIVADARVDAQRELIAKLTAHAEQVELGTTDVELLFRAYRAWGEECVEHLLGDFAFAVWDGPRQRLFCARDHLGVKPFFYAHLGGTIIFSNTLDCIRQHTAVSDKLNDSAIADFLIFDRNQNPATTFFVDIQRLPPAHWTTWSSGAMRTSRYWTLPIDEPVYFKRADDYTDRFNEVLDAAVTDRLRTKKVAIFMSGGLDSPTLAATACRILRSRSSDCEVRAFTTVIDTVDQNERHYAGLVARRLNIPIHFRDLDQELTGHRWNEIPVHTPEPVAIPMTLVADREQYRLISAHTRVAFSGEGPDNALHYEWQPYLSYLGRSRRFGRLVVEVCAHMLRHKRIPLLATVPRMFKNCAQQYESRLVFPAWLNENFESRMRLRARLVEQEQSTPARPHPVRPAAYRSFHAPVWEAIFGSMDPGETATPVETRHPFVDLRLLRYMLAVPAIPWCREKYLMRRAARFTLPDSVLQRPKSPLTSDPIFAVLRQSDVRPLSAEHLLHEYVNCECVPKQAGDNSWLFRVNIRPSTLNYWLRNLAAEAAGCQNGGTTQ